MDNLAIGSTELLDAVFRGVQEAVCGEGMKREGCPTSHACITEAGGYKQQQRDTFGESTSQQPYLSESMVFYCDTFG